MEAHRQDDEVQPADQFAGSGSSSLRALAGPGSGKTYALVKRVARLLDNGVAPRRILVVTFARTAARDLIAAVAELDAHGGELVPRTLHSYCFGVLAKEGTLHATGRVPRILLGYEVDLLLGDLPDALGTLTDKKKLTQAFVAAWARQQAEEPGQPVPGLDQRFQDALMMSLRWHRVMLVGEVVPIALSYLRNNPQAPELGAYDHVLVDEYQDLNRAEQDVIKLISRASDVAVIGDDDQSIYAFKYANPDGIREFHVDRPGTEDVEFILCRRCPTRVVTMAQSLIERNPNRVKAPLRPMGGNVAGEIHNVQWASVADEAQGIADFVISRICEGQVDAGRVLILANSRLVGYAIRDAIRSREVVCNSYFREEAVTDDRAKEAITLLTLLADARDRMALRTWLALESTTTRKAAYRRLQTVAVSEGLDVTDVLQAIDSGERAVPYTGEAVRRWRDLQTRLGQLTDSVDDLPGLVERLFPDGDDDIALLRRAALDALEEATNLHDLIAGIRYGVAQRETPLEAEEVRVMSLHASKGLTADLVVIAAAVEGLVPRIEGQSSQIEQEAQREEQRRLLFVGVTRTTRTLVISSYSQLDAATAFRLQVARGRRTPSGGFRVFASTYLDELGAELPDAVRGEDWTY